MNYKWLVEFSAVQTYVFCCNNNYYETKKKTLNKILNKNLNFHFTYYYAPLLKMSSSKFTR